jgi:hypothetical protein
LRVIAILATYNERRFIGPCLEHLHRQGIETYLVDNSSTDETVEIAERYRGRGLIGIETVPHDGTYRWRALLDRKEQLAREFDADWFIHLDADEVRLPPPGRETLAEALAVVDREGYNAVNFVEFTFMPTREEPDHDHSDFQRTLRTYSTFSPRAPNQLKAWKATDDLDLASSAGHRVDFPGLRMWPGPFPMKHYLFLSIPHAIEKYADREYDPEEVARGWHSWRAGLTVADAAAYTLPSKSQLLTAESDRDLDAVAVWEGRH